MSLSSQPPQAATRNLQADASLVLGVLSIILALLNFVPSVVNSWSPLAVVAGFLAMLLGLRGRRMAKPQDGLHRKRAILGVATGTLGASLFAAILGWNMLAELGLVQIAPTPLTSLAPKTFEGGGLKLSYPGRWQTTDVMRKQLDLCQQPGVECLVFVGLPPYKEISLNAIRFALPPEMTLEKLDQEQWSQADAMQAVLDAHEMIKVDGYPAVKQRFNAPSTQAASGRAYILQVNVFKAPYLYQLTGWASSADALKQHQAELEDIIMSVELLPQAPDQNGLE